MSAPESMIDEVIPTIDPDEAHQRAIQAGLVIQRSDPLNCETSIPALVGGAAMPTAHHYVRNHFRIPLLDPASWRLAVGGLVTHPLRLPLHELLNMRSQSLTVTLECAGNGRSLLKPSVDGEPWGLGAVSTAEWRGVPLSDVLEGAGVKADARELIFHGADGGAVDGHSGVTRFERSLTLDQAREVQPLLAYEMNGEPLPIQHGYPLRLIVPGWYGVASVKWLTAIDVTDRPFRGYFQHERYFLEWDDNRRPAREPLTLQRIRALITEPTQHQELDRGEMTVRGVAWSGLGPIARIDVRIGDGPWEEGQLQGEPVRHSWQWWELTTRVPGPQTITIRARATDITGQTQPDEPQWNRLGYGANPVQEISVRVR